MNVQNILKHKSYKNALYAENVIIDLEKLLSTSAIPVGKTPHSVRIMK